VNPLYHLDAREPLSVAALRDTIASVLVHAVGPDGDPLSDTKDVVIAIGDKVYPLSGIAVAFHGGRIVLQLVGTDVPPCHYCGRIGNHPLGNPCQTWERLYTGKQVGAAP
jgi:hypothetical protein